MEGTGYGGVQWSSDPTHMLKDSFEQIILMQFSEYVIHSTVQNEGKCDQDSCLLLLG